MALFCEKECQLLGWKDHRFECKALLKISSENIPDIEVRLLGRIVYRHKVFFFKFKILKRSFKIKKNQQN